MCVLLDLYSDRLEMLNQTRSNIVAKLSQRWEGVLVNKMAEVCACEKVLKIIVKFISDLSLVNSPEIGCGGD